MNAPHPYKSRPSQKIKIPYVGDAFALRLGRSIILWVSIATVIGGVWLLLDWMVNG